MPGVLPIETEPVEKFLPEAPITKTLVPSLPPFDANQGNIATDGNQVGYLGWGCTISYATDMGLRAQPLATNSSVSNYYPVAPAGATSDFVRVHGGQCIKTVTCVTTRLGQKPILPSLNTQTPNDVLLAWNVAAFCPPLLPDGSQIFGVVAQFIFALQRPPDLYVDSLDMGSPPFTTVPPATNLLNPADYTDYIVGPAQPVANMPTGNIRY